ncbi:MAG: hypothetical protein D3M94_10960 [Rhodocyclales bacterium GT-UBC]|nr:MAG: hypothetical protein D3M94_10960 [Rhodocyclales bacterium GT-UBC]
MTNLFFRPLGIALMLGALHQPALAGDGHDHGEAPATTTESALPRFVARSENLELVGVLDERKLTLFLDRQADNSPVDDARIELEIGNHKLLASRTGAGEFAATLKESLPAGELPVTASVVLGNDADLLAGSLDLHPDAHTDAAGPTPWKAIAAGALLALAVLASLFRLRRQHARRLGGAA